MDLRIGDKVRIVQDRPGGPTYFFGTATVERVTKLKITLSDGSAWRTDGYAWGSKSTRGLGRSFERRIEKVA